MSKRKFEDETALDKIMSSEGRLQEKTVDRRKAILEDFKTFVAKNEMVFKDLLEKNDDSKARLERTMVKYLAQMTIIDKKTKVKETPKGNTMRSYSSHLKIALAELTNYDFGNNRGKKIYFGYIPIRMYSD